VIPFNSWDSPELGTLQAADEVAGWAQRSLPTENTLTAADAQSVEASSSAKVQAFSDEQASEAPPLSHGNDVAHPGERAPGDGAQPSRIETDARPAAASGESPRARRSIAAKTIRLRDREHRTAFCAAALHVTPIMFGLPSRGRWDAR
jgi:hypothetical protein